MSQIKLLLNVVSDMRNLADSIQAVVNAMMQNEEKANVDMGTPNPKTDVKDTPVQPTVTLEQVRTVLAEKSRNNLTAEVRTLLEKYGAKKLSEVDSAKYANLLADAEELGNG